MPLALAVTVTTRLHRDKFELSNRRMVCIQTKMTAPSAQISHYLPAFHGCYLIGCLTLPARRCTRSSTHPTDSKKLRPSCQLKRQGTGLGSRCRAGQVDVFLLQCSGYLRMLLQPLKLDMRAVSEGSLANAASPGMLAEGGLGASQRASQDGDKVPHRLATVSQPPGPGDKRSYKYDSDYTEFCDAITARYDTSPKSLSTRPLREGAFWSCTWIFSVSEPCV